MRPPPTGRLPTRLNASENIHPMRRPGFVDHRGRDSIVPSAIETIKKRKTMGKSYQCYLFLRKFVPLVILLAILYYLFSSILVDSITNLTKLSQQKKAKPAPGEFILKRVELAQKFEPFSPTYGFVMFGSYRTGPLTFAIIGMSGLALRDSIKLGTCLWKELKGAHRTKGTLHAYFPGEHHDMRYETIIVTCELEDSTEHDAGGRIIVKFDDTEIVGYEEPSGAYPIADPLPPFKYRLAFCSPPLAFPVHPQRLSQWIEYHLYQGIDFMTIYDAGGLEADSMAVLRKYVARGKVEVVPVHNLTEYDIFANGQVLVLNDCIYRMKYKAQWVVAMELSEYFSTKSGITLASLLDTYPDKPYVSFGSLWWSVEKCLPDDKKSSLWGIQRMVYRWPQYYCTDKEKYPELGKCLDQAGFRKMAFDPRQIKSTQIHSAIVPKDGGVNVDADTAWLNRWPNMIYKTSKYCAHVIQPSETVDWWALDPSLDAIVKTVQARPSVEEGE